MKSKNITKKKCRRSVSKNEYITVQINKTEFKNGMLELVFVNDRPYSLLKDSGMTKIIGPIIAAAKESGCNVSTERESLQRDGEVKKGNVKKKIIEELAGKFFSICIDLGTATDGRSVLGINTQYMLGDKLVFRCLSMRVNNKPNTAVRIAVNIWDVLNEFGLSIDKLISITSDNGANVLKCIKILRILQAHILDDYLNHDIEKIDFEMLERLIELEIQKFSENFSIHGVKCCAHTLNLCLDDGMKGEQKTFSYQKHIIY